MCGSIEGKGESGAGILVPLGPTVGPPVDWSCCTTDFLLDCGEEVPSDVSRVED